MATLHAIFGSANHVLWWQECCRGILILCYGVAIVRLTGRRVFGKWSALDIIVSVVVGSALSRALTGNAPLWGTLAAVAVLIVLHWALSKLVAHSAAASHVIEGRSVDIARDGELFRHQRLHHALSDADLNEALHQSSVEAVDQTRRIVLEPSGNLSIFKKQ